MTVDSPGAGPLATEPRDDGNLGCVVVHVDGGKLYTSTHDFDQPLLSVDTKTLQMEVQHSIPNDGIITSNII